MKATGRSGLTMYFAVRLRWKPHGANLGVARTSETRAPLGDSDPGKLPPC